MKSHSNEPEDGYRFPLAVRRDTGLNLQKHVQVAAQLSSYQLHPSSTLRFTPGRGEQEHAKDARAAEIGQLKHTDRKLVTIGGHMLASVRRSTHFNRGVCRSNSALLAAFPALCALAPKNRSASALVEVRHTAPRGAPTAPHCL
jgi:hypothetical protein